MVNVASSELKACSACKASKRKCTKTLPQCRRCQQRGLACRYEAKPRIIVYYDHVNPTYSSIDSNSASHNGHQVSVRSMPNMDVAASNGGIWPSMAPEAPLSLSLDDLRAAWFLTPEAWTRKPTDLSCSAPLTSAVTWAYVYKAQSWLREWATRGNNPFIHAELYSEFMPTCVQDSFMALLAYFSTTIATKEIVLRMIRAKAEGLLATDAGGEDGDVIHCIGRVHALLVYAMLGLFDGGLRERSLSEEYLPALIRWAEVMREEATRVTARDGVLLCNALKKHNRARQTTPSHSAFHEELLWRAWIISETVRRTWYVCILVRNAYQWINNGSVECIGTIPFTTRSGVWQAVSAGEWMRVCAERSVEFTNRNEYHGLVSKYKVEEVDDFTLAMLEVDMGTDSMNRWREGIGQGA